MTRVANMMPAASASSPISIISKSHKIIADGLSILRNLEHRGAVGADPKAGDGAGVLLQIPHEFFLEEGKRLGFALPVPQHYAVA